MIDHVTNECTSCHGTGKVVQRAKGIPLTWPCSCPTGRQLAAPALAVGAVISFAAKLHGAR